MQINDYGQFPQNLPIVVEDEIFLYPFMIAPIFISDAKSIESINYAMEHNSLIMIISTKNSFEGSRDREHLLEAGVIGSIMRKVALPDGRIKILFQGLYRGKILSYIDTQSLIAKVDKIGVEEYNEVKVVAMIHVLREKLKNIIPLAGNNFPPDLLKTIDENHEPNRIIDLVASSLRIPKESAYAIFIETNIEKRFLMLIDYLVEEIESLKLQREIRTKVHSKIEKNNKEYFLKEQLKQIQKELGVDNQRNEELEEYKNRLEKLKPNMPEDGYKEVSRQLDKLARMHPDSGDANLLQNYIELILDIPFGKVSKKKLDIKEVETQLNKDHFSLKKPKERIVEYFAVRELQALRGSKDKNGKGTILCFIGPPGVGKTSLANSIAKALKRELVRIALGGLEDISELRGHRRTYIGAMPGRIIQGLIDAKEMNPVVVLDEIDKVGKSFRGDPTAVLLEILDPEQNDKFRDYYLNFNIDLSQIIFIATANEIGSIPSPLRDRMEFISVSSYTPQEKFEIAKNYLIPQELKKHSLKASEISISQTVLKEIIENYTKEAGVRNLRRVIAKILRKVVKKLLDTPSTKKITITENNLVEFLEKPPFDIEEIEKDNSIGIVNGLAWTPVGGDVLKIEATKIKGKGTLQLTGSLGDVMKESARIAFTVVKVLIDEKKIKCEDEKSQAQIYNKYDLHLHVPAGAIPKDGPSAGITMAVSIASILTNRKVKSSVAMTGELTLSGKVLPIGGLKEKLIAAHRANIKIAIVPKRNYERDLDDIPDEVKAGLEIIAVERVEEVFEIAFE